MILPAIFVYLLTLSLSCYADETSKERQFKLVIDNDAGGDDAVAIFLALLHEKHFNGMSLLSHKDKKKIKDIYSVSRPRKHLYKSEATSVSQEETTAERKHRKKLNNQNLSDSLRYTVTQKRIMWLSTTREFSKLPKDKIGAKDSLLKDFEGGNYYGTDGLGDSGEELTDLSPVQAQNAVSALIDLAKAHPGELTVITLGPLTNIALAVRLDPDFITRLAHLYIGAGHVHDDANPLPEFNARMDVEAYHIVLEKAHPDNVTLLPFSQVRRDLNYSKTWRQDVLGAIDNDVIRAINKYEHVSMKKNERWQDLDPAVVAIAIKPDLVNGYTYSKNKIHLNGEKRGINTNDFVEKSKANVRIAFNLNKEDYRQFLFNVFNAESN